MIFRGVEADVPGIRMHHVEETSTLTLDDLPTYNQRQVRDGISASSLDDARGIVSAGSGASRCAPNRHPRRPRRRARRPPPAPGPPPTAKPGRKSTASPLTERVPEPQRHAHAGLCTEAP